MVTIFAKTGCRGRTVWPIRFACLRVRLMSVWMLALCLSSHLGFVLAATPESSPVPSIELPAGVDPTLAIDLFLEARWQTDGIAPAARTDDATFIRRLYLDVMGRIPTPAEMDTFLSDTRSDKRDRSIDQLLATPDAARHLAELFDAMLLGRREGRWMDRRRESGWYDYLQKSFAENRSWQLMARDMILARDTKDTDVRAGWFLYERRDAHQEIAESVAPSFFGIRIECAQCHDHPLASEILQSHYWGLVAFFNRGKNLDTPRGPRVAESAVGGFNKFTDLAGDSFETQLTFFESPVIAEERLPDDAKDSPDRFELVSNEEPAVPKFSRRQAFADQILTTHPLVSRAMVNRLWALYLGRGLVHPVDRMDSMHPPSHPELLDWLSDDFRRSNFDVRRLVRALLRTRAYQLDSRPSASSIQPDQFAYAITKPLTAEQLVRSMLVATTGQPQEPDNGLLQEFRKAFPDVLPESHQSGVSQALLLSNHPAIQQMIADAPLVRTTAMMADDAAATEHLFRVAWGRQPDDTELSRATDFLSARGDRRDSALRSLYWTLLTSAEFYVNH